MFHIISPPGKLLPTPWNDSSHQSAAHFPDGRANTKSTTIFEAQTDACAIILVPCSSERKFCLLKKDWSCVLVKLGITYVATLIVDSTKMSQWGPGYRNLYPYFCRCRHMLTLYTAKSINRSIEQLIVQSVLVCTLHYQFLRI